MPRLRAIATILVSALLAQLLFAMPALAVARILAARCCDVNCPELPSAATSERCCSIGTAAAGDPTVRSVPADVPIDSFTLVLAAPAPRFGVASVAVLSAPQARAAPLYLTQRSLQL
jgi:hypothetical protein